jgi:hypothetical protein
MGSLHSVSKSRGSATLIWLAMVAIVSGGALVSVARGGTGVATAGQVERPASASASSAGIQSVMAGGSAGGADLLGVDESPVPGPAGPEGPAGADGADGADGETGPAGETLRETSALGDMSARPAPWALPAPPVPV